jgi:thiamine pyrophosphokinase
MASPDLLLCADGGANTVRRYGAEPDAVVGDLDSASAETLGAISADRRVRVDADNSGTDLNKVLTHAVHLGVTEAVLLGVTGRRTDHTLWNLSLLKRFSKQMQLRITDDYCHIYLLGEQSVTRFAAIVGQRLSLSPLDGAAHGVTTKGLRWELTAAELVPGVRDGISNEVVQSPVCIEVRGPGHLLLITQREGEEGGERSSQLSLEIS